MYILKSCISADANKFKAEFERCQKLFKTTNQDEDKLANDLEKLKVEGDDSTCSEAAEGEEAEPKPGDTSTDQTGDTDTDCTPAEPPDNADK